MYTDYDVTKRATEKKLILSIGGHIRMKKGVCRKATSDNNKQKNKRDTQIGSRWCRIALTTSRLGPA